MKKTRKAISVLLVLILIMSLCMTGCGDGGSDATGEETYVLKVGTVTDDASGLGQALTAIAEEVNAATDGRLQMEIYWSSTLGATNELAEGVSMGTIDVAVLSSATVTNYAPVSNVLSLPYLFRDREHLKAAIEKYEDAIYEGIEGSLGIPLWIADIGAREFISKEPVYTIEDYNGLATRIQDSSLYYNTFTALGCIPTTVAVSELFQALQQGVVDATELTLAATCDQKLYESCKYVTMTNHIFGTSIVILSEKTAEKLPEDLLEVFYAANEKYKYMSIDMGEELDMQWLAEMKENGVEVIYPEEADLAEMRDACKSAWADYVDLIGQDLIDGILAL